MQEKLPEKIVQSANQYRDNASYGALALYVVSVKKYVIKIKMELGLAPTY